MSIDKDKMDLMRLAARKAGKDGDIIAAFDELMDRVTTKIAQPQAVKQEKEQPKKPRTAPFVSHKEYMEILQAFILLKKEIPAAATMKQACDVALNKYVPDAGVYLQRQGYLEKQGSGPGTVWTILKNPDGTPFNPSSPLTVKIIPPGQAYGYGEKQDKAAFNPAYRDHTR